MLKIRVLQVTALIAFLFNIGFGSSIYGVKLEKENPYENANGIHVDSSKFICSLNNL